MQRLLIRLIHGYRKLLSPLIGQQCRFTPSCSHYTEEAIELYGAARGSWMGVKRILRCQPFFAGGHDPVPGSERAALLTEPGDDSGSERAASLTEPGDDTGSERAALLTEPGDDTGSERAAALNEPGNDSASEPGAARRPDSHAERGSTS